MTKVLTVETSGIAPGLVAAHALSVPLLYARKKQPVTMIDRLYIANAPSHTKPEQVSLMVSAEFLSSKDRVLLVDDFLASGATLQALSSLVLDARATLLGIAVVIEKEFEKGREHPAAVYSLWGAPADPSPSLAMTAMALFAFQAAGEPPPDALVTAFDSQRHAEPFARDYYAQSLAFWPLAYRAGLFTNGD